MNKQDRNAAVVAWMVVIGVPTFVVSIAGGLLWVLFTLFGGL